MGVTKIFEYRTRLREISSNYKSRDTYSNFKELSSFINFVVADRGRVCAEYKSEGSILNYRNFHIRTGTVITGNIFLILEGLASSSNEVIILPFLELRNLHLAWEPEVEKLLKEDCLDFYRRIKKNEKETEDYGKELIRIING